MIHRFLDEGGSFASSVYKIFINLSIKPYVHGMRPMLFLSACVWFRDVTSISDASGVVSVRVEPVLAHQTHCSESLLLERRPYQTHQKRTRLHEIRRMRPKIAQDACREHPALHTPGRKFGLVYSCSIVHAHLTKFYCNKTKSPTVCSSITDRRTMIQQSNYPSAQTTRKLTPWFYRWLWRRETVRTCSTRLCLHDWCVPLQKPQWQQWNTTYAAEQCRIEVARSL